MPEEINRVLTDQISDLLYTTERSALENLAREGIAPERVQFVGNLMIDSLHAALPKAVDVRYTLQREGFADFDVARGFGLVTLHRPSNVDDPAVLAEVLEILDEVGARIPLIWPMHPRTRASIERAGLADRLAREQIACLPPQGYLEMVGLMHEAAVALTDSGGVQEETTALGTPCLTMRSNTERPITIEQGTNMLVGRDRSRIVGAVEEILRGAGRRGRVPEYWDGHTAQRIAAHLGPWLARRLTAAATNTA